MKGKRVSSILRNIVVVLEGVEQPEVGSRPHVDRPGTNPVEGLVDRASAPEPAPEDARDEVWERLSSDLGVGDPDQDSAIEEGPAGDGTDVAGADANSASSPDAAGLGEWLLGAGRAPAAVTFLAGAVVGAGAYGIAEALWDERDGSPRDKPAMVDASVGEDVGTVDTEDGDAGQEPDGGERFRTADADAGGDAAADGGSDGGSRRSPSDGSEQRARQQGARPEGPRSARTESTASEADARDVGDTGTDAPSGVSHERLLLRRAQAALGRNRPDEALEAVRAHEKRYPNGQLVEERETLHVRALYEDGLEREAARRARIFLRNHPDSIFRSTVEEIADADADAGR